MLSQELAECLGAQDKQWLFSKLPEVKDVSERWSDAPDCLCRPQVFVLASQSSGLLPWVCSLLTGHLQVSSGPGAPAGGGHSALWRVRHRPGPLPGSQTGLFTLCDKPGLPGADVPAFAVSYYFYRVYKKIIGWSSEHMCTCTASVCEHSWLTVHKVQTFPAGCPSLPLRLLRCYFTPAWLNLQIVHPDKAEPCFFSLAGIYTRFH